MSGWTPKRSVAPPAAIVEPRLDLVEDEDDAVLLRDLADGLEVARLGSTTPRFIIAASMIRQAGVRPSCCEALDPPLHRVGVVERHRDRQVGDRLRDRRRRTAATARSSRSPILSYSTPIETITASWWPW